MSESFKVPEEVLNRINKRFHRSNQRRKIAYTLMYWNKKPDGTERQEIAEEVGREETVVRHVMRILKEEGLFTDDFGSIPLYRHTEKMGAPDIPETRPFSVEMPQSKELGNQLAYAEANRKGMGTNIEKDLKEIKKPAIVKQPENVNRIQQLQQRILQLENQIVDNNSPADPFEDMTREQMIEVLRSQPHKLTAMANPNAVRVDQSPINRIKALSVTLRPMIVMFTPYSQMLYEKVVHDESFDGTMSDFVNFAIERYFVDRGYSLDWNKR